LTQTCWRIRLGAEAEKDFARILKYTRETFGPLQTDMYRTTLLDAFAALGDGPDVLGSVARDEILPNLRTLHVARQGRRGRHLILYRPAHGNVIEVIRILHDAMELARHVPPDND
jgi:toxin ParE1/3/4